MVHAPALPSTTLNPHQSRQSRRLYIGNLPPGISDAEISSYVNETLTKSGKTKNGNTTPVIAVQLNAEKNFAFVEFAHPEDTNLGTFSLFLNLVYLS